MEFKHFSHEHALNRLYLSSGNSCNMCNRKTRTGESCYYCWDCYNCIIHKECAERPEQIKHHTLHPHHSLLLAKRSLKDTSCCYYCQKPFDNDEFVYACDQLCSDSYMHMECALIPLPTITSDVVDGGQDRSFVRYACHEEAMTLVEHPVRKKRKAKCFACQSGWSGPAYSCTSEMCEKFLHKACAELPQKIQPAFHSHHSLILQVSPPRSCRGCCKKDCRVMYSCHEDGCNFNLCIECRSLDTRVRSRSHDHWLSLVEKSSCEIQCDACQDSYDHMKNMVEVAPEEFELTRSIIFRCMDCVFNIHFLCGPLPSIIRYEYHIHPLILFDHSTIEDDSDEYYCDVCEKESDQAFRIYCCKECKYVSHIHCLFHEIMKVIKGDTKDRVELQTLGDNRWEHDDLLKIDHSKELIHHEEKEFTLKDIVDGLTEPDKQLLINPFGSSMAMRRNTRANFRQWNSWFHRKGSIEEDIDRTQRLFHISDYDLRNFGWEIDNFTVDKGLLKLDEKYLRQKVEDVGGYMVPKTLAPILITSLRKYGDLGGYRRLTPAMKSVTSTILCIVIDKMCKTKVEALTWDDLRHSYFYLNGIKEITRFKIDMYLRSLKNIKKAFLYVEANRSKNDVKEKLHRRIAELKAEFERCEENREKLNMYTSEMSDWMKDCETQALKWKHKKYWGDVWF